MSGDSCTGGGKKRSHGKKAAGKGKKTTGKKRSHGKKSTGKGKKKTHHSKHGGATRTKESIVKECRRRGISVYRADGSGMKSKASLQRLL